MIWRSRHSADGQRSHGVTVAGDNLGIISTGKNATAFQIQVANGAADLRDLSDLKAREVPALSPANEREPVGRAAVIKQVAADLTSRSSVQLHGPQGAGKQAIVRAVVRRLSADGIRGFELHPPDGAPHTLNSVYERLVGLFFSVTSYRPPEEKVRAVAGDLTALVIIYDCDLPSGEISRLLTTFPGCTFLMTSQHPTIGRAGIADEIEPLSEAEAIELITQEIGQQPTGLQQLQLKEAYRLADGQVQRLLQYAAFVKSVITRPGHRPPTEVAPDEIAAILVSGLSEPARRILVALASFGAELTPPYFAAVTGLPAVPLTGPTVAEAGSELKAVRLVTAVGDKYRITADAAAVVLASQWPPASAEVAAHGLLLMLTERAGPRPSPALLLGVARSLSAAQQHQQAARFIRAAAPAAIDARDAQAWIELVALGITQALAAGTKPDLEYFLREEHTRSVLVDDRVAAAAALAALLRFEHGAPSSAHPVSHSGRIARGLVRPGGKAVSVGAGHGTASVVAAVAVTAVVAAASFTGGFGAARTLRPAAPAVPRPVSAAARMPAIAYATDTSLLLRHGTARPRVLGAVRPGTVISQLVWSWNKRWLAWLSGPSRSTPDQVHVTNATSGITHSWACSGCVNAAFQGSYVLADNAQGRSLTSYPVTGGTPSQVNVFGTTTGGASAEILGSMPRDAAVLFFSAGEDLNGPFSLYQATATGGKAAILFRVPLNAAPGGDRGPDPAQDIGMSPDKTILAYEGNILGGDTGESSDSVTVIDLRTGTYSTVSLPDDRAQPLRVSAVWVDSSDHIYASAWHQPGNTSSGFVPPNVAVVPDVYRLNGGNWTMTGTATPRGSGGQQTWIAMIDRTGAFTDSDPSAIGSLDAVADGMRVSLASGVTAFAWAPSSPHLTPFTGMNWSTYLRPILGCLPSTGAAWDYMSVPEASYVDVTGDGVPDELLVTACPTSTSSNPAMLAIFDGTSPSGKPKLIGLLPAGKGDDYERLKFRTKGMSIMFSGPAFSGRTPQCCPDIRISLTYQWRDGRFIQSQRVVKPLTQ